MIQEKKKTYIDLFSGCGGLSLGLYNSGKWKGLFAIEKSPHAFSTLKHNLIEDRKHFHWPSWLPQKEHNINQILKTYMKQLKALKGRVELVAGGPPCQGFSTAGRRIENDKRNELVNAYIKFIRIVQPKVLFFENVKGFTQKFRQNKTKGLEYSKYVVKGLSRGGRFFKGYDVIGKLVDFSEYGIPQKRTRFILIGVRKDLASSDQVLNFFKKIENEKEQFLISKGLQIKTSLRDAISDLLMLNGVVDSPDSKGFKSGIYEDENCDYQKLMRSESCHSIPDSHRFSNHASGTVQLFQNLINHTPKGKRITAEEKERFNVKKRSILVLDPDVPGPTLTTHPDDYIHYCEPRILTVREYARIQTFPDSFEFKGKYTTGGKQRIKEVPRYSQVGNAIPPLFGELVGNALNKLVKINGN